MIYLASPYTHNNEYIRLRRYRNACKAASVLMKDYVVFCPIAHSHAIGEVSGDTMDYDFWMAQDLPVLAKCDKMIVLQLDGWDESRGVIAEIEFAKEHNIPVEYMEKV